MGIAPIYVWTHDSVALGEDGPTHQPIEHLNALRLIPNLDIVRPADANETSQAWLQVLKNKNNPAGIVLTRQGLPVLDRSEGFGQADQVSKGAYVYAGQDDEPDVILIATGSEVQFAVEARLILEAEGVSVRVVSAPCLEWFDSQSKDYQESVLPKQVKARVSIEAGVTDGWRKYVGDNGESIGIDHFGASADYKTLYTEFGITTNKVVEAAKRVLGGN